MDILTQVFEVPWKPKAHEVSGTDDPHSDRDDHQSEQKNGGSHRREHR